MEDDRTNPFAAGSWTHNLEEEYNRDRTWRALTTTEGPEYINQDPHVRFAAKTGTEISSLLAAFLIVLVTGSLVVVGLYLSR